MAVVIALTTIIMLTLSSLFVYFYRTNGYTLQQSIAVSEARGGVRDALRIVREASYGADGSYPISAGDATTLTVFSDVDGDGAVEKVHYALISGTLYRTVIKPAGSPPSYAGQSIATTTIASSVVNGATPVFEYFDDAGTKLSTPIALARVRSIITTLVVDVNVDRAPISFTLSGGATLRNLKTN